MVRVVVAAEQRDNGLIRLGLDKVADCFAIRNQERRIDDNDRFVSDDSGRNRLEALDRADDELGTKLVS